LFGCLGDGSKQAECVLTGLVILLSIITAVFLAAADFILFFFI
jgi:hypothetical protein